MENERKEAGDCIVAFYRDLLDHIQLSRIKSAKFLIKCSRLAQLAAIFLLTGFVSACQETTKGCSAPAVLRTVNELVNKNMTHVGKDDGLKNSTIENIEGDHATIDAVRTVQVGNPISGYTCTAFAHGVNADGSLFDKRREHVSFEYTVQPIDNNPNQFVVELKRW